MSDEAVTEERAPAPEVARPDVASRPAATPTAGRVANIGGLQQLAGNRAVAGLVQRHRGDGTGPPHTHRIREMPIGTDVRALSRQVPQILQMMYSLRPDANLAEDQIPDVAALNSIVVWSADYRMTLASDGTPRFLMADAEGVPAPRGMLLLADPGTGRLWRMCSLYHEGEDPSQGYLSAQALGNRLPPSAEGVDPGPPFLIAAIPDLRLADDPALLEEIEQMIAVADEAEERERRLREGPPGWARRAARNAAERRRNRRRQGTDGGQERGRGRDHDDSPGGPNGTEGGTGTGVRGTGRGGGGDARTGIGTAESGDGTGSLAGSDATGRGSGDDAAPATDAPATDTTDTQRPPDATETPGQGTGETPADRTQSGSGQTAPMSVEDPGQGDGTEPGGTEPSAPMSEQQRRQRVSTNLTMTGNGDPAIEVNVDGATGTVEMRRGESEESLDERLDELEQELADSRDPTLSTRVQGGATATGVSRRAPAGAAAGRELTPEQARTMTGATGGGGAAGEMIPGASAANTRAWPSTLQLYGVDNTQPITMVTGATNQAAMNLDRGSDVLDYFQRISYTWELIDVTNLQAEDRRRASASTGVGAAETIGRGEGQWRDMERTQEYIAEDDAAESWAVRAATYQLMGLSAGIRTLGSVISSFVSLLTEPRNERSIPWGTKGEFILRAVASPVPSDDALADPDNHIIRASSVKCLPVRVVDVNDRATEVNNLEEETIDDVEHRLAAAQASGDTEEAARLQARLTELMRRRGLGAVARVATTMSDLQRQIRFCQILHNNSDHQLAARERVQADPPLTDEEYGDLWEYRFSLAVQNINPYSQIPILERNLAALTTQHETAERWRGEIRTDHRPNVTLVSEENGQVYQMLTMLGEKEGSNRNGSDHHWVFYDITSDKTQRRYHGHSSKSGDEGRNEAIRNAFIDFRENAEYGRGTIAIRMPDELSEVPIEAQMRAAPGATARWMRRLEDLATAAEIAALVLATAVTGGGAAAAWVGAAGALAGAAIAAHRMHSRHEGDRLRLDYETFMDVLAIVGAAVSVIPGLTAIVGRVAGRVARTAGEAGNVRRALNASRWAQRAEVVDRGLHIFGVVQGIGQTVIQVPYDVMRQFADLEQGAEGMSPGELRARRAMILLNGVKTGAISFIGLEQSLGEPMPHVRSDADIWSQAADASGPRPTDGAAGPVPAPQLDAPNPPGAEQARPRRLEVEAPDIGGAAGDHTPATPDGAAETPGPTSSDATPRTPDADVAPPATDVAPPPDRPQQGASPAAPSTPRPRPEASRSVGSRDLIAAARRILFADRSTTPPTGRIRVRDAAEFAATTGHDVDVLASIDSASSDITINGAVLDASPGLAASLEALVVRRGHPTGRQSLGDLVGRTLVRQVIRNVFGGHPGIPAGADHSTGRQILNELSNIVGSTALLDAYFQGTIGEVRDRLRERYGHGRSEAILEAARSGALGDLLRLTEPTSGNMADSMGGPFTDAVGESIGRPSDGPTRRRQSEQEQLVGEVAEVVGGQPLRDAYFGGDTTHLEAGLREHLGGDAALEAFTDHVRGGDFAAARRQLSEAASGPLAVPAEAVNSASAFNESLAQPAADAAPAADVLHDLGSFELARDLVESGSLGGTAHADAARTRLQEARMALVDGALEQVRQSVEGRFEGVQLELQDFGTQGFLSDRDVTLRATPADPAAPPPLGDLVRASAAAVREAYAALRARGLDPARALDTNFYTELHEGSVQPSSRAEAQAISTDQTVTSIMEIAINAPDQLRAVREAQLAEVDSSGAPDHTRAEMRSRIERQFAQAERRAAELTSGNRDADLQAATDRLDAAMQRTPPPSAREIRQLMADVKLLEPDAYGTRAAVEGVVLGQQARRRASTPDQHAMAASHMGRVDSAQGSLTQQLEHRLQQARSALGHLLGQIVPRGQTTPIDVVNVAKQLARVTHAFQESGMLIDHPLLNDAGAVVASKAELNPESIIREVRVWAERSGQRFRSDQALLDAYVAQARQLGIQMSSRLGANTEAMRTFDGPAGDDGPPPMTPAEVPTPAPVADGGEMTADSPVSGRNVDGASIDADGAAARRGGDNEALAPHEVAHDALLDQLRAGMAESIPPTTGRVRPIATGEVGRFRNAQRAHRSFRDAVSRAGGREVGLFFERATGTYAVVVGREASVSPPRRGGPWECPIHTHPNPENVLTYRMPAPNDVLQYWQTAMRTGRPASAFVEYPMPDGSRGQSSITITPDAMITFEYPGQQQPETLSIRDYQDRWDSRTRMVEPGTEQYQRFLEDMADQHRRNQEDGGFSADAPMRSTIDALERIGIDLRERLEAVLPHALEAEARAGLSRFDELCNAGQAPEAGVMVASLERMLRNMEQAEPLPSSDVEGPAAAPAPTSSSTTPGGPAATQTAPLGARLADLQAQLRGWLRARTTGSPELAVWSRRLLDIADTLSTRPSDEATERLYADLADNVAQLDEALSNRNRPVQQRWLDAMSNRLQANLARLNESTATSDPDALASRRAEVEGLIADLRRLQERMDPTREGHDPDARHGPEYRDISQRERELGRSDGDVVLNLSDPATRAAAIEFFQDNAQALIATGDIGALLHERMIAHLRSASELTLQQSPRSSGAGAMDTADLRQAFITDQLPNAPAEYQLAFHAAAEGTRDSWPRTSGGHAWEVDHVHELWAGGLDAGSNLLALPPGLHRQVGGGFDPSKTGMLRRFRQRFRDQLRVRDAQVDVHAGP